MVSLLYDKTEPRTTSAELAPEDYQEVKEAMISEIKQNPRDWKLEKEGEFVLVKHWKSRFSEEHQEGFREEEWEKIENALKNQNSEKKHNVEIKGKKDLSDFPFGWVEAA